MDAITLLKNDHKEVEQLFQKLRTTRRGRRVYSRQELAEMGDLIERAKRAQNGQHARR